MRRLTLVMPYYMNRTMLARQLEHLAAMPRAIRDLLEVIIVDDGSPDGLAQGTYIGMPLRIFRIDVDVRWNQDAARNIGVHHAECYWLLLTDIDHMVPRETFDRILLNHIDPRVVYRFSRVTRELRTKDSAYKPHPNSWLMTTSMYEKIGGYDERFAGLYGTDADFRDRVQQHAGAAVTLPQVLIRIPRTIVPDASTTTYLRKQPVDDFGIPRVKHDRALEDDPRPKRMTFPYHQIWPAQ